MSPLYFSLYFVGCVIVGTLFPVLLVKIITLCESSQRKRRRELKEIITEAKRLYPTDMPPDIAWWVAQAEKEINS
jgi:hypothetical protein